MIWSEEEMDEFSKMLQEYSFWEGWIVAEELLECMLEKLKKRRDGK